MIAEQEEPGITPTDPDGHDVDDAITAPDAGGADEPDESSNAPSVVPPGAVRRAVLAALAVVGLDQVTKWWALRSLKDGLVDVGIFDFRLIYNTGASFGLGSGYGAIIGVVALVVALGLIVFARTVPRRFSQVLLGLIAGGAIGNVIDRLFRVNPTGADGFMRGAVIDFIDFRWWPVFNVADMAVVCGAVLLVLAGMRED